MTLGELIARLQAVEAELGPELDVLLQVGNADDGRVNDAFDIEAFSDPLLHGVLVVAGLGPADATGMSYGKPAEEVEAEQRTDDAARLLDRIAASHRVAPR